MLTAISVIEKFACERRFNQLIRLIGHTFRLTGQLSRSLRVQETLFIKSRLSEDPILCPLMHLEKEQLVDRPIVKSMQFNWS